MRRRARAAAGNAAALVLLAALAAAPLAATLAGNGYILSLATRAAIFAIAAVSLQFIVGFAGLVSFGHAAFLGIGAYALLILGTLGLDDAAVSLPAGVAIAALFAAATGWVALRTRGVTFIMITLAFGQMAFFVAQSLSMYGGDDGMTLDRRPPVLGSAVLQNRMAFHFIVLGVLVALVLLARAVSLSRFGRALRGARENAERVASFGFDVRRLRLIAYVISGAAGALAGWLLAVQAEFVSPAYLDWRNSGELLMMVILGGTLSPQGAAIGAIGLILAEEILAGFTEHWRIVIGPALVLIALTGLRRLRAA